MSGLACNFCAHRNPEGSTFCNVCGSPLNLTLCSRCEAINVVWAKGCSQCGAPLSSGGTEEMAIAPMASTEIAQSSERAPTKFAPAPVVLAERLHHALLGDPPLRSYEPQATDEKRSRAAALDADPVRHGDDGPLKPSHGGCVTNPVHNPNRARGLFLVVLVAVGGVVYWMSIDPTYRPDLRTLTGRPPSAAPESASSAPAAPAQTTGTPNESPTGDRLPAGPPPLSAGSSEPPDTAGDSTSRSMEVPPSTETSSESPATARESISPGADVEPPVVGQAPQSVDAHVPSQADAAESLDGGTTKATNAGATGDAHRQGRTKDQAERDAIATQRLITREFADSPPPDSNDGPSPGR